jgi:hypothetical protein
MPPKAFRQHLLNTIRSEFRMFHKTLFFKETKNTAFVVQRTTLHDERLDDYKENNYTWNLYDIMVEAGVSLT